MRKEYYCYVFRYDYFDTLCSHNHHESGYEFLGSNPIEALKAYRKIKSFDYDHGDSCQKTFAIRVSWIADKPKNNHNFFTKEVERLKKFPVIGWDGSTIDYIVTSEKELMDNLNQLNNIGYYYDTLNNVVRSCVPTPDDVKDVSFGSYVLPYESNEFDMFDINQNDILPF